MNESTERNHDSMPNDDPDTVTRLLMKYSQWRRRRLVAESNVPIRLLALRTVFLTGCVLVDGVFLPWIVIALNRAIFSYALFATALVLAVFLEARFYFRWKKA
jgi:hypothetical protein